jgi:acetyltransferase-like isoleucine patch superfamily enzyme
LRQIAKSVVRGLVTALDKGLQRFTDPTIVGREYVSGLDRVACIYPTTILSVRPDQAGRGHIVLGQGVYLGRRVELEAGRIEIDDDTSLQDGCAVRGDVKIGAHCAFGHNGLVISTTHRFRDRPEWLIRDQDAAFHAQQNGPSPGVQIDDDCWFGWGSTVMPGVHIGRGAVIGANCVVTRNVRPYEIHGGAPNRRIGQRLVFAPPASISAQIDGHLPYFYRGFRLRQEDLKQSRADGVIFGRAAATVVLAAMPLACVVLRGRLFGDRRMTVRFWLNGRDLGERTISPGDFGIQLLPANETTGHVQEPALVQYTVLGWQEVRQAGDTGSRSYGISAVELLKADYET